MGCGVSSESANSVSLPQPAGTSDLPARDLYDRKELMGVGNHGRVYRALHQLSGKEYAVKVIDRLGELNAQLGARERKGLVERLKKLKSPLITQYLEVEVREGEVAVVMELVQQGTLKKYIQKNGKLVEDSVSKITAQILQGLVYLHSNGILHKDLKPSNVLMVDRGVQLSDYALAEIYDQRLSGKG
jgi:calcium/calmodulin-dependent protein kinase I